MGIDISSLSPWRVLLDVIELLLPLISFAFVIPCLIYIVIAGASVFSAQNSTARAALSSVNLSFMVVSSFIGIVLGMFVKMIGGFNSLGQTTETGTVIASIGSILILTVGILAQFLSDTSDTDARRYNRPIGALALLLCFIVSGFYWKLLA